MLSTQDFLQKIQNLNINFFCGVPDSLLKEVCAHITDAYSEKQHVITANEGGAVALAAGYYLATKELPLVYMQNSGLGNAVNPLSSLCDPDVYSIPMLLMIGWRGEPGIKDEPQHMKKGAMTIPLLECLDIPYQILPTEEDQVEECLNSLADKAKSIQGPVALLVKKNTFSKYKPASTLEEISSVEREDAIEKIIGAAPSSCGFLGNTGKISRELYELRNKREEKHIQDFLNVGSMGHTSQIALGVAMNSDKEICVLDGDGSLLMHMGGITNIGFSQRKNIKYILLNNAAHDSVGGQPTLGGKVNFPEIAKASGFQFVNQVSTLEQLEEQLPVFFKSEGPSFLEVMIKRGARADLGRPKKTPKEGKEQFMAWLND